MEPASIQPVTNCDHMGFAHDLSPELMRLVNERMQPRGWSTVGFLESNQSLEEVVNQDEETIRESGVSYKQIADRLDSLFAKAQRLHYKLTFDEKCKGKEICIEGKYLVKITAYFGSQICPFNIKEEKDICGKGQGSADFIVTRLIDDESVTIPSLFPHLALLHHFFERGHYALPPIKAISFFGLSPEGNYAPNFKIQHTWSNWAAISEPGSIFIRKPEVPYESYTIEGEAVGHGTMHKVVVYVVKGKDFSKGSKYYDNDELVLPWDPYLKNEMTYLFYTSIRATKLLKSQSVGENVIPKGTLLMPTSIFHLVDRKQAILDKTMDRLVNSEDIAELKTQLNSMQN